MQQTETCSGWTDSTSAAMNAAARATIRHAGTYLIFLSPCNPDLNSTEMVFTKLKTLLHKADKQSIAAVWRRIGHPSSTSTLANAQTTSDTHITTKTDPATL